MQVILPRRISFFFFWDIQIQLSSSVSSQMQIFSVCEKSGPPTFDAPSLSHLLSDMHGVFSL